MVVGVSLSRPALPPLFIVMKVSWSKQPCLVSYKAGLGKNIASSGHQNISEKHFDGCFIELFLIKSAGSIINMSWFLMNNKKKDDKKKDEIKKQFLKAVSLSNETDGKLSRDQWTKVLIDAGIKRNT